MMCQAQTHVKATGNTFTVYIRDQGKDIVFTQHSTLEAKQQWDSIKTF